MFHVFVADENGTILEENVYTESERKMAQNRFCKFVSESRLDSLANKDTREASFFEDDVFITGFKFKNGHQIGSFYGGKWHNSSK